jgi:macrolide transport system ATP-binding/permease protein
MTKPSNVLILDEPTNFIDLKTIEALESLIKSYQGTVIFTSHDSYFVENVATEIYELKNQKLILR